MTVEDAIKILKEDALIQECMIEHDNEIDKEIFDCDASSNISKKQALDMAIESLEKQIPKTDKFRLEISGALNMPCPNCGKCVELHKKGVIYCDNCGQAILDD